MRLLIFIFAMPIYAQCYDYNSVFTRNATGWDFEECTGTVTITNDSIKISNGKEFEVLSKQKFIRIGDTVFTCSGKKYLRLICHDKLNVYYELQVMESTKFEKYCLVKDR